MHTYTHGDIHACLSTDIHTYLHGNKCAYTHVCLAMHTYIHTYIIHIDAFGPTYKPVFMHTTYMYSFNHAYMCDLIWGC